jgi:hypothetical protein
MKDFSFGIVQCGGEYVPIIESVSFDFRQIRWFRILTNLGPYTREKSLDRLVLDLSNDGKVTKRRIQRYYANYGEGHGEESAPYWDTLQRKPMDWELENARKTIHNTLNGAYGRADKETVRFLTSIHNQILA